MYPKLLQHGNGITDNDPALVLLQIPDKLSVNLDLIQCLVLQHIHSGITCSEIVHGHQKTMCPQIFHPLIHSLFVLEERAFCQF